MWHGFGRWRPVGFPVMLEQVFLVDGQHRLRSWFASEESFGSGQSVLARVHARGERVYCLCRDDGVECYVAKHQHYFIARMPDSGPKHAPDCPSYAPAAEMSGLSGYAPEVAQALQEEHPSFEVSFPLLRYDGTRVARAPAAGAPNERRNGRSRAGRGVSLGGVLHLLWDVARLNVWHPKMAGRRNYGLVRYMVMKAAGDMSIRGRTLLLDRLYMPEPFSEARRDELTRARSDRIGQLCGVDGAAHHLGIIVGFVKAFDEVRYGGRLMLRHDLNESIWMKPETYASLNKRHCLEVGALVDEAARVVVCGLVEGKRSGGLALVDAVLMRVSAEYLPLWSHHDALLTQHLLKASRTFIKPMRFEAAGKGALQLPNVLLTDAGGAPLPMFVLEPTLSTEDAQSRREAAARGWMWDLAAGHAVMPPLPRQR